MMKSAFPSPAEFRKSLTEVDLETILQDYIMAEGAVHVSAEARDHIKAAVVSKFSVSPNSARLWIVGSAKLGFSLSEKKLDGGGILPRYRLFRPESDVDVAIVCPGMFDQIWTELSSYAHRSVRLPWDSGRLGDYFVCGWIRPDHFPRQARLRKCDDWWDCFTRLSAQPLLGRRKVRGGLFYSVGHLKQYLVRSVNDCISAEERKK